MESNISGMEVGETTWDIESDHLTCQTGLKDKPSIL